MNMINLPTSVLSKVSSFLPLVDLKNFRLTCTTFYEASFQCKETLKKIMVSPTSPNETFYEFVTKFYGGRFVKMSLLTLNSEQLQAILPKVQNIEILEINIQQLYCTRGLCKNLKVLYLVDKKDDFFSKWDSNKYKEYFESTLSHLSIKELHLAGKYQVYYNSIMLMAILNAAKSIDTFSMKFLRIDHKEEVQEFEHFKRHIQSCKHIRHWYFLMTSINDKSGLVLPETVLSYENIKTIFL